MKGQIAKPFKAEYVTKRGKYRTFAIIFDKDDEWFTQEGAKAKTNFKKLRVFPKKWHSYKLEKPTNGSHVCVRYIPKDPLPENAFGPYVYVSATWFNGNFYNYEEHWSGRTYCVAKHIPEERISWTYWSEPEEQDWLTEQVVSRKQGVDATDYSKSKDVQWFIPFFSSK